MECLMCVKYLQCQHTKKQKKQQKRERERKKERKLKSVPFFFIIDFFDFLFHKAVGWGAYIVG